MQNYFIHIMIWGISIAISSILALYQKDSGIVWSMCAIYFVLYYLTRFVKFTKVEKKNMVVSETGIFGSRALLMVDVSQVGIGVKILLMFTYGIITLISVIPNSFMMKVATINDGNKYN